ncbi:MAG TPA: TRAP transporter substrate-binding protein [Rhodobacteraceae bacterium]|nr:TRAP transporter substrate-binding protein [Paracoccaceae bacterium]
MKKFLLGAASAIALTVAANAAVAKTVIKVATLAPPNTPWTAHLETWKDNVAKASGGDIDIQIFPSAQLGNEFEVFKQVQRGRIDVGAFSGAVIADNIPEISLMSTPFLFKDAATIDCVYDQKLGDQFSALIDAKGMKFLQWQETGWVYIYAQDDLSDVAAAEGYKIRVSPTPISRMLWNSVGAAGVEIPYAETPAALQTGLVRGGESAAISFVAFGLGKVAPHFMRTEQYHMAGAITISNKKWDSLSAEQQKILVDGLPPVQGMRDTLRQTSEYLLGKYAEAGGPIHELSEAQLTAWRAKVEPNWPAYVSELGDGASAMWPVLMEAKAACGE